MLNNNLGQSGFTWFIGVVEDRNDPEFLGRVRVRCYGYHTDDKDQIPTNKLPLAVMTNGIDSASISGVGKSPTGIVEGSWVIGFFLDGNDAQEPVVIGTIPSMSHTELPDFTKGFSDPNENFPREVNESDVNKLARGTNTKTHTPDETINEPSQPYNAKYPYNHVYESESGHTKEYDDTEGHERIRERHRTGTFYEVHPNGDKVTHVVANNYTIIASNDNLHVKGNVNIIVDGTINLTAPDGDIVVDGVSLVNHTHTDTAGLGAGTTSSPNKS